MSKLPRYVHSLLEGLQPNEEDEEITSVKTIKAQLLLSVQNRLGYILSEDNISLRAACFDPEEGGLPFIDAELKNVVWSVVESEYNLILNSESENNFMYPSGLGSAKSEINELRVFFEKKLCKNAINWL